MGHYEKITVITFRVISCCVSFYALMSMTYNALSLWIFHVDAFLLGIYAGFAYAIVGTILFALSKPLAALITRSL